MNKTNIILVVLAIVVVVSGGLLSLGRGEFETPADPPAKLKPAPEAEPTLDSAIETETKPVTSSQPRSKPQLTGNNLPENWSRLSNRQKTELNPLNCDSETEYVRSDNGQCATKKLPVEAPAADGLVTQPETKKHPDHYLLEKNHICTKSIPPVCYLTLQIAVDINPPNEDKLRQELERIALDYLEEVVNHFAILGYYYNGSDNYLDYIDTKPLRVLPDLPAFEPRPDGSAITDALNPETPAGEAWRRYDR